MFFRLSQEFEKNDAGKNFLLRNNPLNVVM
jgi:hypothetical protein